MRHAAPALLAAIAAIALTACGSSAPAAPPAATHSAAAAAAAPAPTCKQQSDAWKTANATTLASFKAALVPFTGRGAVTAAQATALSTAAQAAGNAPPPSCADPKGYYQQAMAQLVTAGTAASGGGALSELGALTPMENAESDITLLDGELLKTIGASKL